MNKVLLGLADEAENGMFQNMVHNQAELQSDVDDLKFLFENIPAKGYVDEFDHSLYYGFRQIEYTYNKLDSRRKLYQRIGRAAIVVILLCAVILFLVTYFTAPYTKSNNPNASFSPAGVVLSADKAKVILELTATIPFFHHPLAIGLMLSEDAHIDLLIDPTRKIYFYLPRGLTKPSGGGFVCVESLKSLHDSV